jgi:hypothetical protein
MAAPLSAYVDFGSLVSLPPPIVGKGGQLLGLVLDADIQKLETWCDTVLNQPANGTVRYKPVTSQVLLMSGSFAEMTSGAKKFINSGAAAETQVALFVPLNAEKKEGGKYVDNGLCVAVPYIFVDNPMSYASGREDYGYPKAMGIFSPGNGLGSPMTLEVFGGNLARNNSAGWTTLLTLERVSAGAGPAPAVVAAGDDAPSSEPRDARVASSADEQDAFAVVGAREDGGEGWRSPSEIVPYFLAASGADAEAIEGAPGGDAEGIGIGTVLKTIVELIAALLNKSARQVFLKQFRDVKTSTAACYQAVVEAPFQVVEVTWRPSSEWRVEIEPLTSHPITTELGIVTQTTWKALELQMGLLLAPGEVVGP